MPSFGAVTHSRQHMVVRVFDDAWHSIGVRQMVTVPISSGFASLLHRLPHDTLGDVQGCLAIHHVDRLAFR